MDEDRIDCYGWVPKESPFSVDLLYIDPDDRRSTDKLSSRTPDKPPNVCVIGGGIAGLTAAYELAAKGCEVTLLEAGSRFGGRIETWYFPDGTYSELGAMRIPKIHGCVMHYIRKLGLRDNLRRFTQYNPDGLLALRGIPPSFSAIGELWARLTHGLRSTARKEHGSGAASRRRRSTP